MKCVICERNPCRCDPVERDYQRAMVAANGDTDRLHELTIGLREYQRFFKVKARAEG